MTVSSFTSPRKKRRSPPNRSSFVDDGDKVRLSNCKRKQDMMEAGAVVRFRDELEDHMQGLEQGHIDELGFLLEKCKKSKDFSERMRASQAINQIYERLGEKVTEGFLQLVMELSKDFSEDFKLRVDAWKKLIRHSPRDINLIQRVIYYSRDAIPPELKASILVILIQAEDWLALDACWQDDPERWIQGLGEEDLVRVVRAGSLGCLVTLSGSSRGPGIIHAILPGLFQDLISSDDDLDLALQTFLINLVDRDDSICRYRSFYAKQSIPYWSRLREGVGMGAVLALILHRIDRISLPLDEQATIRAIRGFVMEELEPGGGMSLEILRLINR